MTTNESRLIRTAGQAIDLAHHLLDPARPTPVALITHPAGRPTAWIDVAKVVSEVGDQVEVVEMPTGPITWAFSGALAQFPGTECYGGAGRVYPVGLEWTTDLSRSPLRFTYSAEAGPASTDRLITDALHSAFSGGFSARQTRALPASGVVLGTVSGRALVLLETGETATIVPELTVPQVDAEHLFCKGQRVAGSYDPDGGRLDVADQVRDWTDALSYQVGDVVVARVGEVAAGVAIAELFPRMQVRVSVDQVLLEPGPRVDLREWLTVGETVAARVVSTGPDVGDWQVSLVDVDADQCPVAAAALLPGGPAWLDPPVAQREVEPEAVEPEVVEQAAVALPAPPSVGPGVVSGTAGAHDVEARDELLDELAAVRIERDDLARRLEAQTRRVGVLEDQVREVRTRARQAQAQTTKLRGQLGGAQDAIAAQDADRGAFLDPVEQFRYEVDLAWARRIPAAEKAALARSLYVLSDQFLGTLQDLPERDRAKLIDVTLDVITGRVYAMPGRETHQLRTGTGGSDPYVRRADGSVCWRTYLQHKTPQARRLHFWVLSDGTIELSAVRQHDNYLP